MSKRTGRLVLELERSRQKLSEVLKYGEEQTSRKET